MEEEYAGGLAVRKGHDGPLGAHQTPWRGVTGRLTGEIQFWSAAALTRCFQKEYFSAIHSLVVFKALLPNKQDI